MSRLSFVVTAFMRLIPSKNLMNRVTTNENGVAPLPVADLLAFDKL
jgi:hypothetical protein